MEGLSLGPVFIRWNGLLIALGVALGAFLAMLEAKRRFQDSEVIYYLFLPVVLWGWIVARLWHVFTPPLSSVQLGLTTGHYLSHPLDILSFWIGGFGIPGVILGGTFALWLFARREHLSFWDLADVLTPGLLLALVIGRLGNYFNQELYGLPTKLPWGIFIDPAYRLPGYEQESFYHPLFAYEMLLCIAFLVLLLWLSRGGFSSRFSSGDLFLLFLGGYSLIRILLEFLRLDVALIGGVNINQIFFGLLLLISLGAYLWRRRASQDL